MMKTWNAIALVLFGVGAGLLAPSIATLAGSRVVSLVLSRYAETISSMAILGMLAGVVLMAAAIPSVVAGERR